MAARCGGVAAAAPTWRRSSNAILRSMPNITVFSAKQKLVFVRSLSTTMPGSLYYYYYYYFKEVDRVRVGIAFENFCLPPKGIFATHQRFSSLPHSSSSASAVTTLPSHVVPLLGCGHVRTPSTRTAYKREGHSNRL